MGFRQQSLAIMTAILLALSPVGSGESKSFWMDEADLDATFSGQTIAGLYPNGRGFVETFYQGGRVTYQDELRKVGGRWVVKAGTFCTIYDGDASGGCYSVRRTGDNCYEFYFIARTEEQARRPGEPTWTAQAWLSNKPSSCVAGAEV